MSRMLKFAQHIETDILRVTLFQVPLVRVGQLVKQQSVCSLVDDGCAKKGFSSDPVRGRRCSHYCVMIQMGKLRQRDWLQL